MIKKNFILLLFILVSFTFSEDNYGTFLAGARGSILAIHEIAEGDSVSILQGVGYIEVKIGSKKGQYINKVTTLPKELAIDSITLSIEESLSLKVYSVLLEADSLHVAKKGDKALILLSRSSLPDYRYDFSKELTPVIEKNPVADSVAMYGRDGKIFVELKGSDLSTEIVSHAMGRTSVAAKVTFMKKYLPLLSGFAAKIDKNGFFISYDTVKAQYDMKDATSDRLLLVYSDSRELDNPELSFWSSSKDKKVISLPEITIDKLSSENEMSKGGKEVISPDINKASFVSFPLYVVKDDINVRKDPSTNGKKIATLPFGTVVTAIDENEGWFQIRMFDDNTGWIYKTLVKKEDELSDSEASRVFALEESRVSEISDGQGDSRGETKPAEVRDEPEDSVVVFLIKDNVNLRSVPKAGSKKSIVGSYSAGTRMVSFEKKNNWSRVQLADGSKGWIYSTFLLDSSQVTPEMWDSFYNSGKPDNELVVEPVKDVLASGNGETFDIGTKPNVFKINEEEKAGSKAVAKSEAAKKEKAEEQGSDKEVVVSYKKYGRDPFLPLDVKNLAKPGMPGVDSLSLIGVIFSDAKGAQNYALFEERVKGGSTTFSLKEGEPIENGRLLHIEENRVVFLMREADFTYTVEKILEKIDE